MADYYTGNMKAVIQTKYGGPEKMSLVTRPIPRIRDDEILVKIRATNVASGDWRVNTMTVPTLAKPIMRLLFGITGPRQEIRGLTAAGDVVKIGAKVKDKGTTTSSSSFQVGDRVYFINTMKAGCLAEYIALNESTTVMAKIPESMSYVEAAPLAFGAMTASCYFTPDTIQANHKVLIYGGSGAVGTYAIQLAKYYGADVTAVSSAKNHKALLRLGADHVIDYTQRDFREGSEPYDVILDAVGKITKQSCRAVLNPRGGAYYTVTSLIDNEDRKRLEYVNKIIDERKMKTLVEKVYPLSEFKEAHSHTYSGHKCGNIVIQISSE